MSKFHDLYKNSRTFQAWNQNFKIPGLSRTCANPVLVKSWKINALSHQQLKVIWRTVGRYSYICHYPDIILSQMQLTQHFKSGYKPPVYTIGLVYNLNVLIPKDQYNWKISCNLSRSLYIFTEWHEINSSGHIQNITCTSIPPSVYYICNYFPKSVIINWKTFTDTHKTKTSSCHLGSNSFWTFPHESYLTLNVKLHFIKCITTPDLEQR